MAHILQALAQHWHLSASHYWQLRLVCAIALGPLLGVLCLVAFRRRASLNSGAVHVKRQLRALTPRLESKPPLRPATH